MLPPTNLHEIKREFPSMFERGKHFEFKIQAKMTILMQNKGTTTDHSKSTAGLVHLVVWLQRKSWIHHRLLLHDAFLAFYLPPLLPSPSPRSFCSEYHSLQYRWKMMKTIYSVLLKYTAEESQLENAKVIREIIQNVSAS